MYCPKCGKELENGIEFCPDCGAKIEAQPEPANTYSAPQAAPDGDTAPVIDRASVSKKEYIEKYAPSALRKNINSMAIICYLCCAISVIGNLFILSNPLGLIDVAVLLALTLGVHLGKSKVCAIILLIVSIIECVFATISLGTPSGWWWIVASVSAVSSFVKLDKQYNLFLLGGSQIPEPAQAQPFVPNTDPAPAQTEVYYTPSQPAEPEATPDQPAENPETTD